MIENTKQKPLDMLHGSIWNKLPLFALPVAATAILEQLFNASDIAVVGNFTGAGKTIAVAAVGANSSIISLIVNLFVGIALGGMLSLPMQSEEKIKMLLQRRFILRLLLQYWQESVLPLPGNWLRIPYCQPFRYRGMSFRKLCFI